MKFNKRLRLYLVGVGIGVLLSFIIFDGRGCEWLPSNRVLDAIQNSKIVISERDKCIAECEGISADEIYSLIESGDVNFGESDVRVRNYKITDGDLTLFIKLSEFDTVSSINHIQHKNSCEECEGVDSNTFVLLYKPNDLVLKKLRGLSVSIKEKALCEFECFGLTENSAEKVLEDGEILFDKSFPNRKPNPVYYIKHRFGDVDYLFWVEQGATKVRFLHVVKYNPSLLSEKDRETLSLLFEMSHELKDCNCN